MLFRSSSTPAGSDGYDAVDEPATGKPSPAPVASPAASRAAVASIVSVKRIGQKIKVTVAAPAGVRVTIFRNGVRVASGTKRVFMVPAGRIKSPRFSVSS